MSDEVVVLQSAEGPEIEIVRALTFLFQLKFGTPTSNLLLTHIEIIVPHSHCREMRKFSRMP